ncbi:hypothetical protein BLD44_028405 [Mastigocladus laminosus UU774]|nr:hypothetical protein BLD44_028405 [Mastigocladus laminosus UU774]
MTREHAENLIYGLEHSEIGSSEVKTIIKQILPQLESLTETELLEIVTTKYDRPSKKELYGEDNWF